eukprot:6200319-Pleurochrysis_carterae.AAC.2
MQLLRAHTASGARLSLESLGNDQAGTKLVRVHAFKWHALRTHVPWRRSCALMAWAGACI